MYNLFISERKAAKLQSFFIRTQIPRIKGIFIRKAHQQDSRKAQQATQVVVINVSSRSETYNIASIPH